MDGHQLEQIKSRKKAKSGETDEEIWIRIYMILFPETTEGNVPTTSDCCKLMQF
jgi:hypothetical protein